MYLLPRGVYSDSLLTYGLFKPFKSHFPHCSEKQYLLVYEEIAPSLTSLLVSWCIFIVGRKGEVTGGVWFSGFLAYPESCDQEAETVWSLCSPRGVLPHEANMQFHLSNLRCKNRSLGRDAHRQKNRLLHEGSFYVEGP